MIIQGNHCEAIATFGAAVLARMVHQNLPHEVCSHAEKVRAALPVWHFLRHQADVSFMDKRRGLKGVGGVLISKIGICEPPQLLIDNWSEAVQRVAVAALPVDKKPGNVVRSRWHQGWTMLSKKLLHCNAQVNVVHRQCECDLCTKSGSEQWIWCGHVAHKSEYRN